jgi:hypothetical protein
MALASLVHVELLEPGEDTGQEWVAGIRDSSSEQRGMACIHREVNRRRTTVSAAYPTHSQ